MPIRSIAALRTKMPDGSGISEQDWSDINEALTAVEHQAYQRIIDLIQSDHVTHPSGQIDMPADELVAMIKSLFQTSA